MAMYDYLYFCIFLFVWIFKMKVYFEPLTLTVFPVCSILTGNKKADLHTSKRERDKRLLNNKCTSLHCRDTKHFCPLRTRVLSFDRPLVCVCT